MVFAKILGSSTSNNKALPKAISSGVFMRLLEKAEQALGKGANIRADISFMVQPESSNKDLLRMAEGIFTAVKNLKTRDEQLGASFKIEGGKFTMAVSYFGKNSESDWKNIRESDELKRLSGAVSLWVDEGPYEFIYPNIVYLKFPAKKL